MERPVTMKSSQRLLLNAEPFGFGPTAAIAGLFPHLREHFETIGYMGKRHTLDLQRALPYDRIHDLTNIPKMQRWDEVRSVMENYDILLTAMDHKVAAEAHTSGLKVFYYDALAWYWPGIPDSVQKSDLYLAQDFFGVGERLKEVFSSHANAHVVPPIVALGEGATSKDHILINLGGLQNPYWPIEGVVSYAGTVIKALKNILPQGEKILISASEAVSSQLSSLGAKTYARHEMVDILACSKFSFMTPGLGNIYDAAAHNLPTIWLPPANDSQGQQLLLLKEHDMCDGTLDWPDLIAGADIDYHKHQPAVLAQIAGLASALSINEDMKQNLSIAAARKYEEIKDRKDSKTVRLLEKFGRGGEEIIAGLVIDRARQCAVREMQYE